MMFLNKRRGNVSWEGKGREGKGANGCITFQILISNAHLSSLSISFDIMDAINPS